MQLYIFKCTCAVDIHPLAGAIQGYVYDKQFDTRLKKILRATDVLSISVYAETHRDIYLIQCKSIYTSIYKNRENALRFTIPEENNFFMWCNFCTGGRYEYTEV